MVIRRVVTRTIDSPVGPLLAGVTEPVAPEVGLEAGPEATAALCLLEFTTRPRLSQEKHDLQRLLACPLEEQGEFETGTPATDLLDEVERQLRAYFAGQLRAFDLPLCLPGTPFQQKVWHALTEIPFGETISYDQLAKRVGSVARAVGGANGANRVPIVVPCHRVIGADGSLTGFGGGMANKQRLLEHEGVLLPLG